MVISDEELQELINRDSCKKSTKKRIIMESKDTIMSSEQIDLICEAHRLVDMPADIATHLVQAQAKITWPIAFKAGLKMVGEWLEKQAPNPRPYGDYRVVPQSDVETLKSGKIPE